MISLSRDFGHFQFSYNVVILLLGLAFDEILNDRSFNHSIQRIILRLRYYVFGILQVAHKK